MERLDKILSRELNITRSEAKLMIKKGRIKLNDAVVKTGDIKCSESDEIYADGRLITKNKFVYIMMNKPQGVISASRGDNEKTVIDLLDDSMKRKNLFPAGRLDKDTTGFVLITDDGEFAHNILSPKKHINKTYIATLDKPVTPAVIEDFENGMQLGDEKLLCAKIDILDDEGLLVKVVLRQGLYHQVKRMFKKHSITVLKLHRIAMGELFLDESLLSGESRYITEEELSLVKKTI